ASMDKRTHERNGIRHVNIMDFIKENKQFSTDSYSKSCFQVRNKWMVDRSNLVIAVYNGESGGTRNTIKYAEKHGIKIVARQIE
ncbi:MAG: hypothetical protein MJZ76_10350, partial [Bacteroidales bacterium]|nr:hypothetical protein [Bacteroidales bacterium]